MNIKIGCSGFPIEKEEYYQKFHAVEVLDTFYQMPDVEIAKTWKDLSPKHFEFVEELPKSAVGKILRRELRDMELAKTK